MTILETTAQEIYLDYINNYLTIEKIAEHYSVTAEFMKSIIAYGKEVHYIANDIQSIDETKIATLY